MNLLKLLKTKKTVFTVEDLKKILDTTNEGTIRNYLSRAKAKGLMEQVFYGIYRLVDREMDLLELACKINKNSYISFETVLKKEGVIFQYYENIYLASNKSIEKKALGHIFKTYKLKQSILINPIGINNVGNYQIASPERAICDRLYISKGYFFDNLDNIDIEKLKLIAQIYNKRVILEVNNLIKLYAQ